MDLELGWTISFGLYVFIGADYGGNTQGKLASERSIYMGLRWVLSHIYHPPISGFILLLQKKVLKTNY